MSTLWAYYYIVICRWCRFICWTRKNICSVCWALCQKWRERKHRQHILYNNKITEGNIGCRYFGSIVPSYRDPYKYLCLMLAEHMTLFKEAVSGVAHSAGGALWPVLNKVTQCANFWGSHTSTQLYISCVCIWCSEVSTWSVWFLWGYILGLWH